MASELKQLGELLDIIIDHRGKTPRKLGGDFVDIGIPVISAIHIKNGIIQWDERERFVTTEMFAKWMPVKLQKDDVLLTSEAPLGEVALVPSNDDLVLSQRLFALRCNNEVLDPKFLYYFFRSSLGALALEKRASGSTVIGIRQTELLKIEIPLFGMKLQKAAGEILGSLDDKIRLNTELSQTLEAITQTIFKSWFVDFDPVHAKMRGEKPEGMSDEVAALFPDSFEESELGLIPTGWEVTLLGQHLNVVKGKSYKSSELSSSQTALVTLKSFRRGGGYRLDGLKPFTGSFKPEQQIFPGELVVSFTDVTQAADVIGKPALVLPNPAYEKLVASLDVGIVRPTSRKTSTNFLYQLFLTSDFKSHIDGYTNGTTVLHLSKGALEDYLAILPPEKLIKRFEEIAGPLRDVVTQIYLESITLEELRDSLLSRLITGELEIPSEMLAS